MKSINIALFFIVLIFSSSRLNAQFSEVAWEWLNPLPTATPFFDVEVGTEGRLVAVGLNGVIFVSDDYGATGREITLGQPYVWYDVAILDNGSGLVVGKYGSIARTEDGGASWRVQRSLPLQEYPVEELHAVAMIDHKCGVVVGGRNGVVKYVALRTTDGGDTWTPISMPRSDVILFDIQFADSGQGWIVGTKGALYRTFDSGTTWIDESLQTDRSFLEIEYGPSRRGLIVGTEGIIYRTDDGGNVWTKTVDRGEDLRSIAWIDSSNVVGVGPRSRRLSTDGGLTWENDGYDRGYWSIDRGSDDVLVAVGDSGLITHRSVSGEWSGRQRSGIPFRLFDVDFIDYQRGIIVGDKGMVATTRDGGLTWSLSETGAQRTITNIIYDESGLILGFANHEIVRSTDHGISWSLRTLLPADIKDIAVVDGRHVIAIGNGFILTSHDRGETWRVDTTTTLAMNKTLYHCAIPDSSTMYVLGFRSNLLRSTDGGITWSSRATPTDDYDLGDLHFFDRDTGLFTSSSEVLYTTDGGASWDKWPFPPCHSPGQVRFINRETAWMVTYNNTNATVTHRLHLWQTTNAGRTWDTVHFHFNGLDHFYSLGVSGFDFVNDSTGWLVGGFGAILRYRNGAEPASDVEQRKDQANDALDLTFISRDTSLLLRSRIPGEGMRFVSSRVNHSIIRRASVPVMNDGERKPPRELMGKE